MFQRTIEQVQHLKASASLVVTAGTGTTALFANIDSVLRLILTAIGIVSGIYAALYYRSLYKKLKAQK